MSEIRVTKKENDIVVLATDNNEYQLFEGGCGKTYTLYSNRKYITEFPRDPLFINDYILDLAKMVIAKHEQIRERIKFEGVPDFLMQKDDQPIELPILIPATILNDN